MYVEGCFKISTGGRIKRQRPVVNSHYLVCGSIKMPTSQILLNFFPIGEHLQIVTSFKFNCSA